MNIVNKLKMSNGVRFGLCLAACLLTGRVARAEVVLVDKDDWTFTFDGRVNAFLSGMFAAIGIRLIDFKLEFGRVWDGDYARVILADEISPDGCRLWDLKTNDKLDKDRFRQDLGGVEEAYQEVARRLGLLQPDDEFAVLDLDQHRKKRGK